jgi:hypothetical protein
MADDYINCRRCEDIIYRYSDNIKICEHCNDYFCMTCDICEDEYDCDVPKTRDKILINKLNQKIINLKNKIKLLNKKLNK